jgi:hydrogenase maturation factor
MRLITGEIVEVYPDGQNLMARVCVAGAFMRVPVILLPDVKVGDHVLIESGVAIAKVTSQTKED